MGARGWVRRMAFAFYHRGEMLLRPVAAVPEGFSAERNDSAPQRSGARKGRIVAEEREKADSPKKEIKLVWY